MDNSPQKFKGRDGWPLITQYPLSSITESYYFDVFNKETGEKSDSSISLAGKSKIHPLTTAHQRSGVFDRSKASVSSSSSPFGTSSATPTATAATKTMSPSIELRRLSNEESSSRNVFARLLNKNSHPPLNYRHVFLTGGPEFVSNRISTAKYNLISFIPKFLFEQFRKYSNIFFLFISLMQQIPNVSPTGRWTTLVPLIFIMLVSAIKEIFEDIKRHRADNTTNNYKTKVFKNSEFISTKWKDVRVGDLLLIQKDQYFPSDLVIFSSSEPSGICYVETANLDGETNLKARSALKITDEICSQQNPDGKKELDMKNCVDEKLFLAEIKCDLPNKELYEFVGKIIIDDKEYPMSPENVLLRGAKLRNTEWALGCAIYTGHETKLMMNSLNKVILKQSYVEIMTNRQIIALLGILMLTCLISAICSMIWSNQNNSHWYISQLHSQTSSNFFLILLTFIILYNNLIPISLQVTLEVVKFLQAHFINNDLEMYDEVSDTPAMARTSNLNEELGQVRYILSDKTGTITRNVMELQKFSINGIIYSIDNIQRLRDLLENKEESWEIVHEFLTLLAICHTVIPEKVQSEENGFKYVYQASSPDEAALVKGAQKIGYEFRQRTPAKVSINALGTIQEFEVLYILPFNSDRKRMSTIVRTSSNEVKLYIKGADSIIQQRLDSDSLERFAKTEINLTRFATEGLRTLCCAYSIIPQDAFENWEKRYNQALLMPATTSTERVKREESIDRVMSDIERELILLGTTAIEDKLQDGVPETIETLMKAGINIWMLTGDKLETATNISYSCKLLKNIQALESYHIIKEDSLDSTRESIINAENKLKVHPKDFTLIIDSKPLGFCLQPELRPTFMEVSLLCRSVICCRVSPSQKAEVVDAVKNSTSAITLAIGDGANDVAMIRAANVGVGISGQEGLQAVHSSDYAIAQFRFLARLLLVHGSWSFSRVSKLIFYSFYKNIALYVIELWFATVSAWSGQAIFERWAISLYNVIFTMAPPLVIGLFDRVCPAHLMIKYPQLYKEGSDVFTIKRFWFWIASAIWHSLVLFWLSYCAFSHDALWPNGKSDGGYLCFGNMLYTYVVITVCLKAALETNCWTLPTHLAIWGSILSWFLFIVIYSRVWPFLPVGPDMANIDKIIFTTIMFWLGIAIIPFTALLVDIIVKLIVRTCFKSMADKIIELELIEKEQPSGQSVGERARLLINNFLPSGLAIPSPQTPRIPGPSAAVVSDVEQDVLHGYSFSQEEARDPTNQLGHAKIIRLYNTEI